MKVPVLFTPGVNHTTVAEHTFALILAAMRHLVVEVNHVAKGQWIRITGRELYGKTLGIVGMGRIGREVARRARGFGLSLLGFGNYWEDSFSSDLGIRRCLDFNQLLRESDVITLHTKLTPRTRHLINSGNISLLRKEAVVVNCARGEIVETAALVEALKGNRILAYARPMSWTASRPRPIIPSSVCPMQSSLRTSARGLSRASSARPPARWKTSPFSWPEKSRTPRRICWPMEKVDVP